LLYCICGARVGAFVCFVTLHSAHTLIRDIVLAKPNYSFEKRQRDLEKKRKQEEKLEEKRQRKLAEKAAEEGSASADGAAPADAGPAGTAG
jgi:hypothetical protein